MVRFLSDVANAILKNEGELRTRLKAEQFAALTATRENLKANPDDFDAMSQVVIAEEKTQVLYEKCDLEMQLIIREAHKEILESR